MSSKDGHFLRKRVARITEELKEVEGALPDDLQTQVAITSAMAFLQLVLDRGLGQPQPERRPIRLVQSGAEET